MRISDKDIADLVKYFTEEMPDHESHLPALLDLRDLRKLAREVIRLWDDQDQLMDDHVAEKVYDALKAHLEEKP